MMSSIDFPALSACSGSGSLLLDSAFALSEDSSSSWKPTVVSSRCIGAVSEIRSEVRGWERGERGAGRGGIRGEGRTASKAAPDGAEEGEK